MRNLERALGVALRAILSTVAPLLKTLPNRCGEAHCFDLADFPDRIVAEMRSGAPKRLQRVLLRFARRLIKADATYGPTVDRSPLLRDLTGTWLGLYFLGMPFPHPWEPVARHAERNGYDRDGGIFKAAADVYRTARRELPTGAELRPLSEPIMFLDLGPLAYLKLVDAVHGSGSAAAAEDEFAIDSLTAIVRALGACYEMLQLRMYLEAGGPVKHVILEETLRALIKKDSNNIQAMVDLATRVYGSLPPKPTQTIAIIRPSHVCYSQLEMIPGCVLSSREGVYRSQLASNGGRSGNRVTNDQLVLYRQTLAEAVESSEDRYLVSDANSLREYLQTLSGTA